MAGNLPPEKTTIPIYGREYGAFRSGQYLLPHDDTERKRLDMLHTMFMVVRDSGKRLTNCPTERFKVQKSGWQPSARVLDLGCGTGLWMFEMAQRFPHAEFVGVDIHRMGPAKIEPNVVYTAPWDYEGPWALGEKSWDLIHLQMALGSVSNWQALYQKILDHLVPGTGYFELVELDLEPRCEDDTEREGTLIDWWDVYIKGAYEAFNRRLHFDPETKSILEQMGFKDVEHKTYKIPFNEYLSGRATKRAARCWHDAMGPRDGDGDGDGDGGYGLEAISLAPLCKFSRWPPTHVKRLCNEAINQAKDESFHGYNLLHVIIARAPRPDEPLPAKPTPPVNASSMEVSDVTMSYDSDLPDDVQDTLPPIREARRGGK